MDLFMWVSQLMRVDTVDFMATLFLALVLHYSNIIWNPLKYHQPDLSSGLYICAVLLLLMRPWNRPLAEEGHSPTFWRAIWPNSLKMTWALMLLQHVGLLRLWDNWVWLLDCTQHRLAGNCRLLLAAMLLGYSIYCWLCQLKADADADAETFNDSDAVQVIGDAGAMATSTSAISTTWSIVGRVRCPYCASLTGGHNLAGELEAPLLKDGLHELDGYGSPDGSFDDESMFDLTA